MSEQQNPVPALEDSELDTAELEEVAGGTNQSCPITINNSCPPQSDQPKD
jgi:hypothetical protein